MNKVGIIGAGAMGSGIAQVAATAHCQVLVYDTSAEALKSNQAKLAQILEKLVAKGRLNSEKASQIQANISYTAQLEDFAHCELVIEAIIENLPIKKKVFETLESIVSKDCIIASNTSSLSITSLAAALQKPARFVGIHFFNPAPLMKLVEIIPALQTHTATVETVRQTINHWDKLTVLAKDTPGFIVNKVARPFYSEALRLYEEGIADIATIDWAMTALGGFRMGPFTLMDFIGHDVNYVVTETVFKEFYYDPRYKPSFAQKRLVEAGYLGHKAGRGFYHYQENVAPPLPRQDEVLGQQIVERIVLMLINEAADTVHQQIASKADIDTAMTQGVNYPKGLLQWADEIGIAACVSQLDNLYEIYHEDRYRCSPLLRKMAQQGTTFFQPKPMAIDD
ncbi:MAG TPA: 3-hydroxybutyryl-CoA dehydrogenase [Microscillaceae bacterium]|nr:3-hydroxybutyryl-CoA dehydrogenase [Microscillaceae bacterium]